MSAPRKKLARAYRAAPADQREISPAPTPREPDPLGPLRVGLRRWPIVVVVTTVAVGVAILAGLAQTPTYTATADVNVGRVDVRVQTLPGYVAGAQALAAAYSRIASSDAVILPLARQRKLAPAEVRERFAATPIPDSTIFRIYGVGPSEREAVELARAGTAEMERYVARSDEGEEALGQVLSEYRAQARLSASYRTRIDRLTDSLTPTQTGPVAPTPVPRRVREQRTDEIERLQVALDTAQLKMQALGGRYAERGNELAATAGIEVITRPTSATDDRSRTLQRLASIGLVAGVLLGFAVALVYDRRRRWA